MKKRILKKITVFTCLVAVLMTSVTYFGNTEKTVEAKVIEDMDSILQGDIIDVTSSNPFKYTENEYYEEIVDLGMPAVKVLQENYSNDNLDGYVAAIAILDISGVDLYEITGIDWETADEFWEAWNIMIQDIPEEFNKILKEKNIKNELEKYGIFGESLADKIISSDKKVIDFAGEEIECDVTKKQCKKQKLEEIVESSDKELDVAEQYIADIIE